MPRLTEIRDDTVYYTGKHTQLPGMECAGTMRVAAIRDVMQRLAEYEATGLEPEEIQRKLQPAIIQPPAIITDQTVEALHRMGANVHRGRRYV